MKMAQLNPGPDGEPRGAGIRILSVSLAGVHPPVLVAPKFEQVVIAQTNRESMIEDARREEVGSLAEVVGNVDSARDIVALIDQWEAINDPEDETKRELEMQISEDSDASRAVFPKPHTERGHIGCSCA